MQTKRRERGNMATIEDRKNISHNTNSNIIQNLVLENREKLSVSVVLDVLRFVAQVVIIETELPIINH